MALNPQYDAIGQTFAQQYYATFDDANVRANLINFYNVIHYRCVYDTNVLNDFLVDFSDRFIAVDIRRNAVSRGAADHGENQRKIEIFSCMYTMYLLIYHFFLRHRVWPSRKFATSLLKWIASPCMMVAF